MSVLPTLEKIKTELIPAVFTDTVKIGLYGHELEDSLQLDQLDRLLSNSPAAGLGASITAIIRCLAARSRAANTGLSARLAACRR